MIATIPAISAFLRVNIHTVYMHALTDECLKQVELEDRLCFVVFVLKKSKN